MSVAVVDIRPVRKLIPDADELLVVEPPMGGVIRIVTFWRFDNHDDDSHTPTFYVREEDKDKIEAGTPELWRAHIPRVVASGSSIKSCAPGIILEPTQSFAVQLAAAPSSSSDELKWPALTVNWMDQVVTRSVPAGATPASDEALSTFLLERFGEIRP